MENIQNMEYSLRAILYLVELQAIEGLQADSLYYKEDYPFFNRDKYKKEVLKYLVRYNNENLQRILKYQIEICHGIFDKWNNELRFMNRGLRDVLSYNIYCTFRQDNNFPFEYLELIRHNPDKNIKEHGNINIENNRWWGYFDSSELDKNFNRDVFADSVKRVFIRQLVDFAEDVWNFLTDYVSDTSVADTTGKPQQIKTSMSKDEAVKLFNGLVAKEFISKETPLNNFLYRFGLIDNPDTNKPLEWIKTNKTTHNINPNKRSLLDFLTQLGITEAEIKLKIKDCFVFSNGSKFNRNNYEYAAGKLITISDFNSELSEIINKSKEK